MIRTLRDKLVDLWHARELLRQFVAKELKIRYKNSALGFVWSMLTPLLMTLVFTTLFAFAFRLQIENFAAFFLAGYLMWQFFQTSAQGSLDSIVGNGQLIKKVYFPREVLPLSIVLAQLIHFSLALLVLSPFLVALRGWGVVLYLPATLVTIALLTLFNSGISMLFAGANVPFRDLQELIVVIFLVWFYATPVLYPPALLENNPSAAVQLMGRIVEANPMSWFVQLFRETTYGTVTALGEGDASDLVFRVDPPSWPDPQLVLLCAAAAVVVFLVGYTFFNRLALTFAKEV
jgi:ABC-type polysaccharide/polyol phosphate export permease